VIGLKFVTETDDSVEVAAAVELAKVSSSSFTNFEAIVKLFSSLLIPSFSINFVAGISVKTGEVVVEEVKEEVVRSIVAEMTLNVEEGNVVLGGSLEVMSSLALVLNSSLRREVISGTSIDKFPIRVFAVIFDKIKKSSNLLRLSLIKLVFSLACALLIALETSGRDCVCVKELVGEVVVVVVRSGDVGCVGLVELRRLPSLL